MLSLTLLQNMPCFWVVLLFLCPASAFSAGRSETELKKRTSPIVTVAETEQLPAGVEADLHAHSRLRHKTFVRVGFPSPFAFQNEIEAAAGLNVTPWTSIEAAVADRSGILLHRYKVSLVQFGLRGLFFVSDSFYLKGGIDYQTLQSALIGDSRTPLADNDFKAKNAQMRFRAGLGNRWGVERFFMDMEWISFADRMLAISETYSWNSSFSEKTYELPKKANREFADDSRLRITTLSLGYAF